MSLLKRMTALVCLLYVLLSCRTPAKNQEEQAEDEPLDSLASAEVDSMTDVYYKELYPHIRKKSAHDFETIVAKALVSDDVSLQQATKLAGKIVSWVEPQSWDVLEISPVEVTDLNGDKKPDLLFTVQVGPVDGAMRGVTAIAALRQKQGGYAGYGSDEEWDKENHWKLFILTNATHLVSQGDSVLVGKADTATVSLKLLK